MTVWRRLPLAGPAVVVLVLTHAAAARVLQVGPTDAYATPGAAAVAAGDGDTITIAPGTYYNCVQWRANGLTIAASGPGVVITDTACAGKAAFVISGDDVRVRGLTFQRIRVPDGNGAGIRAEGKGLTVSDSRFINNQFGILDIGGADLRIEDCMFESNGASSDGRQTHAVLAGALGRLRVERSVFRNARGGDHVTSDALVTELVADQFSDDGGGMTGPMVSVHGGVVTVDGNTFDLAPGAAARPGAILVTAAASAITVRGNTLRETEGEVPLLRNWTDIEATESDNITPQGVPAVSNSGAAYHRVRAEAASLRQQVVVLASQARHLAALAVRALQSK